MITFNKDYLAKKSKELGFNRDTYEKILRLSEVLISLNADPFLKDKLALKGGTAINFVEFDLPRLSVDIDLDYMINESRDEMIKNRKQINNIITAYMEDEGYLKKDIQRQSVALDSFYFQYTNSVGNRDHIKFDINYVMRAHVFESQLRPVLTSHTMIDTPIHTLEPIEIFASKINALINRAAVRDLYDVYNMITNNLFANEIDSLRKCIVFYHVLTATELDNNFNSIAIKKLKQHDVFRDLVPVLRTKEYFDLNKTRDIVTEYISEIMQLTADEEAFIVEFKNSNYMPDLLFDDKSILSRISNHPMALWKTRK